MNNWRTSAISLVTAFFAFVLFSPEYFPPVLIALAKFATVGGLAALGIASKDANGGKRPE